MAAHLPADTGQYVTAILDNLNTRPERTALRWRGRTVTAAELHRAVTDAAEGLRGLGVGPGTAVGLLTEPNGPLGLIGRYAANLLGATVLYVRSTNPGPDSPELPAADQAEILRVSRADLLLVDAANTPRGREVAALLDGAVAVAALGEAGEVGSVLAATAAGRREEAAVPGGAVVIFTSGSSGRPKGVVKSFTAWNGAVLSAYRYFPPQTFLVITPVGHAVGPLLDIVLAAGGALVLHQRFDAGEALRAVAEEGVNSVYMATPQLYALLDHPDLATADLSTLRQVTYGGCPASPRRLAQALAGPFADILVQTYGTSEAGSIALLGSPEHHKPELLPSVGRPFPGVEVRVLDPETAEELPAGETGEVVMRSAHVMSGYLADPELTARTVREGWLHTGDLGYLGEDGHLFLVGRISDVIKSRSERIHPAAVEKALTAHPAVADATVYGVTDEDGLEFVHAAVVLAPDASVGADQLRAHVGELLSPLHAPVRIVALPSLPLGESGKLDRALIRLLDRTATALGDA
ncbi:class I adenylate-forming enzyme family protein [Kitasatospora sp. NPDC051170]|uniref:class I adenylate-forming enzyme family protein n=1 Tax=Kitasatospora sp. NPDC051170 TaxID=3364056 RepID=UPI0037A8540D